ncbi:MAG: NYN domain-containing protein [Candidatus Krumholzibacteria bacterium]|nr:NYN domain-containing protein [Candidatus Krumholzibacteria bacterium]
MRTNVYVDAFNLYYGALRGTPYKWLDIAKLCCLLLPKHEIQHIRYFTARVRARPEDPGQPMRQQVYLRALETLSNLTIHYGHFLTHRVSMPLASLVRGKRKYVWVLKTEEKGSDVNLATHLLADGFRDDYEAAVVVSNDTDLVEPIRVAARDLGKIVGLLHPDPHHRPSQVLTQEATFFKHIRRNVLQASQFPRELRDQHGTFHKPRAW